MLDSTLMNYAAGDVDEKALISVIESIASTEQGLTVEHRTSKLLYRYIETRAFSPVHRALLGLDGMSEPLQSRLLTAADGCHIDQTDSRGRSPLAWAVEYRQTHAIRILLDLGASAEFVRMSVCCDVRMPLLHLLLAGPTNDEGAVLGVIGALVLAGADVMAEDDQGWTSLHIAASWNLLLVSKKLLELGDHKKLLAARTHQGETAYDLAYSSRCCSNLLLLLSGDEDSRNFADA
jgi:ankyrin repeat protein